MLMLLHRINTFSYFEIVDHHLFNFVIHSAQKGKRDDELPYCLYVLCLMLLLLAGAAPGPLRDTLAGGPKPTASENSASKVLTGMTKAS
jgi:hypothetical protein